MLDLENHATLNTSKYNIDIPRCTSSIHFNWNSFLWDNKQLVTRCNFITSGLTKITLVSEASTSVQFSAVIASHWTPSAFILLTIDICIELSAVTKKVCLKKIHNPFWTVHQWFGGRWHTVKFFLNYEMYYVLFFNKCIKPELVGLVKNTFSPLTNEESNSIWIGYKLLIPFSSLTTVSTAVFRSSQRTSCILMSAKVVEIQIQLKKITNHFSYTILPIDMWKADYISCRGSLFVIYSSICFIIQ